MLEVAYNWHMESQKAKSKQEKQQKSISKTYQSILPVYLEKDAKWQEVTLKTLDK